MEHAACAWQSPSTPCAIVDTIDERTEVASTLTRTNTIVCQLNVSYGPRNN